MPPISFSKKDLPFLLGGAGALSVNTGDLKPNQALDEATATIFTVGFSADGADRVTLGQDETVKLGLSTTANVTLSPIFASSPAAAFKQLKTYGVGDFFKKGANADRVVLCFEAAVSADGAAAGSFNYGALKSTVTLEAGGSAGYAYLRAIDKSTPLQKLLVDFFRNMRLPEQSAGAPGPGEAISLQYGGYLRLAAEVSAGYKLSGTKSFSLGEVALTENYDLSIIGKIGLSAGVAGRFSILVTAGDSDGWCRVQVRRHRAKDLKIAADVRVGFKNELDLPANAHEFLGAVLGVNARSFLTILEKAATLPFEDFEQALDGLAKKYVEALIGKGFEVLETKAAFTAFQKLAAKIMESYDDVENRAVALFDRYFDKLSQLTPFLDKLQNLTAEGLTSLRKELNPELWTVLSQLTDGDPLAFLLTEAPVGDTTVDSVSELRRRATAALGLIRDNAHDEIRKAIAVAKQQFGLDKLMSELGKIDSRDELQALANERVGLFVTRLVGRELDTSHNIRQAYEEVQAVLAKIDTFPAKLFQAFKEGANSSYKLALHAEYSRASEADALIDVTINMANAGGAELLAQAGKGDFEKILAVSDTDLVRLNEGVFTHRTTRQDSFKVNIVGWHLNYKYDAVDRIITETEQRLVPSAHGMTVFSTATLEVDRKRKRQDETMHVNFLLRALGESAGVVKAGDKNLTYLIDALTSLSARYQLTFTDQDTTESELSDYLAFAAELGLDTKGATLIELGPLLPRLPDNSFGDVSTHYDVRFGEAAIAALLSVKTLTKTNEALLRNAMRSIVLANYLQLDAMHDVAFAYATPDVFAVFQREGFATFTNSSQRIFPVRLVDTDIRPPSRDVVLDSMELKSLSALYRIENAFIDATRKLYTVLGGNAISPAKFAKALDAFADAMKDFDDFDQVTNTKGVGTTTVFAMFDLLVRIGSKGPSKSLSALTVASKAGDQDVEKLYLSDEVA